ncbi:MAG: PH domain-containing protein [Lachnospiraceae bacterium]|nr:PH domain-containing protein [Lachnospiraceae bacterium]
MYKKINPKAKWLMLLFEVIVAIITTIIIVVVFQLFLTKLKSPIVRYLCIAAIVLTWGYALISPFVRSVWYRYAFNKDEIRKREGFLTVVETIVPIERLQKLSLETGLFDRMFGLTRVKLTTAGGDVDIRYLEIEKAEAIAESLKNKINKYARNDSVEANKLTENTTSKNDINESPEDDNHAGE